MDTNKLTGAAVGEKKLFCLVDLQEVGLTTKGCLCLQSCLHQAAKL